MHHAWPREKKTARPECVRFKHLYVASILSRLCVHSAFQSSLIPVHIYRRPEACSVICMTVVRFTGSEITLTALNANATYRQSGTRWSSVEWTMPWLHQLCSLLLEYPLLSIHRLRAKFF